MTYEELSKLDYDFWCNAISKFTGSKHYSVKLFKDQIGYYEDGEKYIDKQDLLDNINAK